MRKGKFIDCPCGNKFFLTPGQIRTGHGKYCSRACYYQYRKIFDVSSLSHQLKGDKHWNYKGDDAGYSAFHLRVQSERGVASLCSRCKSASFVEWANLTGKYEDVNDYEQLCRKCHHKFDNIQYRGWKTRRRGDVTA